MTPTETTGVETDLLRRLRRMIELRSLEHVSREFGISCLPLARYLARIPVQPGTRTLIESKLEALARADRERAVARANVVPANGKAATEEEVDAMVAELRAGNAGERERLSRTTGGR